MSFRIADEKPVARIKVFGVGGGGGNAVNTMVKSGLQCVEFIAANTDKQALAQSRADICLQIGPGVTKGLGAGSNPEVGFLAAHESIEEIRESLLGADMVFVAAGLGGGTGTGAAPVVAKTAKELGILTVAVVSKPFSFEGKLKKKYAEAGWQELRKHIDSIITVANDRLLTMMPKSKFDNAMGMADSVLLQAVKGISDIINVPGIINADFADLRTVMQEVGPAIMGTAIAAGEDRAVEAAKRAIDNQLLEDVGISGARGLLINVSASRESLSLPEYAAALNLVQEQIDDEARVVPGCVYDDELGDEMQITVIATGVGDNSQKRNTISSLMDLSRSYQGSGQDAFSLSDEQAQANADNLEAGRDKADNDNIEIPSYFRNQTLPDAV
ncbi:MAG: cell division protein FtsZ [Deltaproteobacteria bacterium]|nr:MAG: cell division protein FtsZ [Deltaproteobacteria bacterium]